MSARPTAWALFVTFFQIAVSGFGGTLPFARRTLVDRRGWLSAEDFTETLSLCQTLPGPNVVNMSIVVGARACGWVGSVCAFAGLVGTPVVVVITLGLLYNRFGGLGVVRHALVGLGASASGLVVATAGRMAEPLLRSRAAVAAPFILAAFAAVALLRLPLPWVLIVLGPLSIAVVWVWRRRA
ncbi:MAG TPA: chromate transporter [Caulobacteraceae bacterium]|nr:chromate transporter [Caulobacteraceae bacterium]